MVSDFRDEIKKIIGKKVLKIEYNPLYCDLTIVFEDGYVICIHGYVFELYQKGGMIASTSCVL